MIDKLMIDKLKSKDYSIGSEQGTEKLVDQHTLRRELEFTYEELEKAKQEFKTEQTKLGGCIKKLRDTEDREAKLSEKNQKLEENHQFQTNVIHYLICTLSNIETLSKVAAQNATKWTIEEE